MPSHRSPTTLRLHASPACGVGLGYHLSVRGSLAGDVILPLDPPSLRDYTRQITAHRQREWSCRYSRVSGLTYEEAVTSEYGVQSLIDQVCVGVFVGTSVGLPGSSLPAAA